MNALKMLFLSLLLTSLSQLVKSQSKSYIIPSNVFYIDANSSPYNLVKGGDTLYFQAGNRDYLCLKNFMGKPGLPIVMINSGGSVVINTTHYYGISIQNCRYIKLTGTGFPGMQYGFDIQRVTNGSGMGIGYLSSDFEIDHVSIQNTLLGGLYAKTDPDCETASTREKFTQFNTLIHDNYIAYSGDEGMYIGSTKYDGQTVNYLGRDTLLMPSLLDGVSVYNNIVKYAGWDGIQVSSASKNCKIYNNTILFDSQAGTYAQMSGIMIGGGTKCDCYNNYICDGKGDGIDCMGLGGTRIFNNVIVNPGITYFPGDQTVPKHGMFISDNSVQKDSSFYIFNNNIINPKSEGIRFCSALSKGNLISSNVIINPGSYDFYQNGNTSYKGIDTYVMIQKVGTDLTLSNNYFERTGSLAGFLAPSMHELNDFKLTPGSPLVDAGDTNPKATTTFDIINSVRPQGLKSDIGAFELMGSSVPAVFSGGTISADQSICAGGLPAALSNVTAPSGYTGTLEYKWQLSTTGAAGNFIDIANSNSAGYAPGSLTAATWFRRLARVTAMIDWTNAVASNVIVINVNPLPAAIAGANRSINLNSSTQIGSTAVSGNTYSWTSSPAGFTSVLANPTVTPLVSTTYTLLETVVATGCTNSHNVVVSVNAPPALPAANAGVNRVICLNSSTQIGSVAVAGNTYCWTSFPVGYASTVANPIVKPTVTTTYTLVETVTATGATNSHSVIVTVNALPAAVAGANRTISLNSNTQIGAAAVVGSSYSWTSSPAGFISTTANPTVSPKVTTTYMLVETNTATGCSNSHGVIVTVNSPPEIPGNFTTYSTKVKLGQSNIVYTVPYVAGVTYVWNWSGRGVTISGNSNTVLVSFSLTATSGTLSVKAVNSYGSSPERSIVVLSYKGATLPEGGILPDSTLKSESSTFGNIDPSGTKNLLSIYPNPSSGSATFEFGIIENATVSIDVFSMTGQRIATIFNENVEAGSIHKIYFSQSLPCGVYPCIMKWKGQIISTKWVITK